MHVRRHYSSHMMCILVNFLLSFLRCARAFPVYDEPTQSAIKATRPQRAELNAIESNILLPSLERQAVSGTAAWANLAHAGEHIWKSRGLLQAKQNHREQLPDISGGPQELFRTESLCRKPNLQPEGPYFIDGQYLRNDITDGQGGVELTLHIQFVDEGCKPFEGMFVDVWHANASGIYSGVCNADNALGANLEQTNFHRGVSQTDEHGVVSFTTRFPGHSSGRTPFIHALASHQGIVNTNNTYSTDYQPIQIVTIFFDQDLQDEIAKIEPYASNTTVRIMNKDDYLYTILTNGDFDPHMRYALKGADVSKGIIGWIRVPVSLSIPQGEIQAAGTLGIPNNAGRRPIAATSSESGVSGDSGVAVVPATSNGLSASHHNPILMVLSLGAVGWALLPVCVVLLA